MANPVKGEVAFQTSDGRSWTLLFSFDALASAEESLDQGIGEIVAEGRLKGLRAVFWAGLRHHHPTLTEKDAGELILQLPGGFPELGALIRQSLTLVFPQAAEAGKTAARPRRANGSTQPST
jgi:hypothetical protein